MLTTIKDIATDFISNLIEEDAAGIRTNFEHADPLSRVFIKTNILRFIRNEYGLWHNNPLTEKWRNQAESRDIRDGVDYSEDHPDNISVKIYDKVKEMLG